MLNDLINACESSRLPYATNVNLDDASASIRVDLLIPDLGYAVCAYDPSDMSPDSNSRLTTTWLQKRARALFSMGLRPIMLCNEAHLRSEPFGPILWPLVRWTIASARNAGWSQSMPIAFSKSDHTYRVNREMFIHGCQCNKAPLPKGNPSRLYFGCADEAALIAVRKARGHEAVQGYTHCIERFILRQAYDPAKILPELLDHARREISRYDGILYSDVKFVVYRDLSCMAHGFDDYPDNGHMVGLVKPSYSWVHLGNGTLLRSDEVTMDMLSYRGWQMNGLSVTDCMRAQGFVRIFDAGKLKYEF